MTPGPAVELDPRRASSSWPATTPTTSATCPSGTADPMVIIGDAAHAPSPTSGQGASMAAEDGVILAKALRDLPTIARGARRVRAARRGRVEKIVAYGARGSSAKMPGGFGRVMRDAAAPARLPLLRDRPVDGLDVFDHRVEWDRPLVAEPARISEPARA